MEILKLQNNAKKEENRVKTTFDSQDLLLTSNPFK
jgi:hypothetical protein